MARQARKLSSSTGGATSKKTPGLALSATRKKSANSSPAPKKTHRRSRSATSITPGHPHCPHIFNRSSSFGIFGLDSTTSANTESIFSELQLQFVKSGVSIPSSFLDLSVPSPVSSPSSSPRSRKNSNAEIHHWFEDLRQISLADLKQAFDHQGLNWFIPIPILKNNDRPLGYSFPLHGAIAAGRVDLVQWLCSELARQQSEGRMGLITSLFQLQDSFGWTPLHWAVGSGTKNLAMTGVRGGLDLSEETRLELVTCLFSFVGISPLFSGSSSVAAGESKMEMIDPNIKDHKGRTVLYLSVLCGYTNIAKLLLDTAFKSSRVQNQDSNETLHININNNNIGLHFNNFNTNNANNSQHGNRSQRKLSLSSSCESLPDSVVSPDAVSSSNALVSSRTSLSNTSLGLADPSLHPEGEIPLLHLAIQRSYVPLVTQLLKHPLVDVNLSWNGSQGQGRTPLHMAVLHPDPSGVQAVFFTRMLLQPFSETSNNNSGSSSSSSSSNNFWKGSFDSLSRLDVNRRDYKGRTPLHEAVVCCQDDNQQQDHTRHQYYQSHIIHHLPERVQQEQQERRLEVVRLLLQDGRCQVNCQDLEGSTPLHMASSTFQTDTVSWLLEEGGANPFIVNATGHRPFMATAFRGKVPVTAHQRQLKTLDVLLSREQKYLWLLQQRQEQQEQQQQQHQEEANSGEVAKEAIDEERGNLQSQHRFGMHSRTAGSLISSSSSSSSSSSKLDKNVFGGSGSHNKKVNVSLNSLLDMTISEGKQLLLFTLFWQKHYLISHLQKIEHRATEQEEISFVWK